MEGERILVKKYNDVFSGFFLLLISVGMFTATFSFKALTVSKVGPDFMPKIIAGLIALVSIAIIVSAFKEQKKKKALEIQMGEDEVSVTLDESEEKVYLPVILSLALMVGYLILLPYIGFLIMTAVYLFFQMYVLSEQSNKRLVLFLIVSMVSSAITYYVFRSIFYVMLPSGILG